MDGEKISSIVYLNQGGTAGDFLVPEQGLYLLRDILF